MKDPRNYLVLLAPIFASIAEAARGAGLALRDLTASPILGRSGTVEFFGLFRGASGSWSEIEPFVAGALGEARDLLRAATSED